MGMSNELGQRPNVVLVTGEPGSGKSVLGATLARELRVPFLARDDVRGGMFSTAGAWGDRPGSVPSPEAAVEMFLQLVESMVARDVSCVVEYVVRRDRPEDLDRITQAANCRILVTVCDDVVERRRARAVSDRLLRRAPVLDALGHPSIEEHHAQAERRMADLAGSMRTEFDLPVLWVATDHGYDPAMDEIVAFATGESAER